MGRRAAGGRERGRVAPDFSVLSTMFDTSGGSYAAGMERNALVTNRLTLAPPSASRRSVARTCGSFTLRCLKAIAESYVQSSVYNPYWIGAIPLPKSRQPEAREG